MDCELYLDRSLAITDDLINAIAPLIERLTDAERAPIQAVIDTAVEFWVEVDEAIEADVEDAIGELLANAGA